MTVIEGELRHLGGGSYSIHRKYDAITRVYYIPSVLAEFAGKRVRITVEEIPEGEERKIDSMRRMNIPVPQRQTREEAMEAFLNEWFPNREETKTGSEFVPRIVPAPEGRELDRKVEGLEVRVRAMDAQVELLRAAVERNREKWTAHAYFLRQLVEAQERIEARLKVLEGGGKS